MSVPTANEPNSVPASADECDEVLHQNERTLVFRKRLADGSGSIICKQPLGEKAAVRLRHERRILERLAGVKGVRQPLARAPSANAIAFDDGDFRTLSDALRGERLDMPAQLALMLELADTLAAVHRAGVVHKDISPANILLCGVARQPLLIDFDLATTFAEERPGFILPQEIAGTFPYLAPEQTGRTGRAVDLRADLYALGAVFYELTLGCPPFDAGQTDPLHLIHDILTLTPVTPAEIDRNMPVALSDIILHLLQKEPDRRYQSAEGLRGDLLRLRDMLARGETGGFPLGERDFALRLLPPSQPVGRKQEFGMLRAAFDNAVHDRGSCVLISGAPGVGKSTLINELRPLVTARRGWFVAGKFDQYRRDLSANAFAQATQALIQLLLAEPEAELAQDKARILEAMGGSAGLLAALVPDMARMLGVAPEAGDTGDQAQIEIRMRHGFLGLLRAVASPHRPLVMVVDDLQWGGPAQVAFIDAMLMDEELRGLLLVCAYRDTEVDAAHPLSAMLTRWQRLDTPPLQLHLDNLPPADLATLLADMLHLAAEPAVNLADAIGARTQGNPFDTVELVNALRSDGVLVLGDDGWHWDTDGIRSHVGKGEVIDLLTVRIGRLPTTTQAQVDTMACLGGDVDFGLLTAAGGLSVVALEDALAPALEDGLLLTEAGGGAEGSGAVRFRHDRVQQAAYARIDPVRRSSLHLSIARRLASLPEFAGMAATNYLAAVNAINDADERRQVAALFQRTAAEAFYLSSYGLAERFLTAALPLMQGIETAADEGFLIALEAQRHATLYSLGRLDDGDAVYRSLEERCIDPLLMADATCVQLRSLTNRGEVQASMQTGLALMRRLGLEPPPDPEAKVGEWMDEISRWVYAVETADDIMRAEAIDPRVLALAKLIDGMQFAVFIGRPALYPWLVVESKRLWVSDGPCALLMASVLSTIPLLVTLRTDYRAAERAAHHLLAVGEQRHYEPATSMAHYGLASSVQHWFEPLENSIGEVQRARTGLLSAGNFQIAAFTYNVSIWTQFDTASSLDACQSEIEAGLAFAARTGDDYTGTCFLAYAQLVRGLRGEVAQEGDDRQAAIDANPMAAAFFHINSAVSAALFGDAPEVERHVADVMPLLVNFAGYYPIALTYFLGALSLAEQAKTAKGESHAARLAEFDQYRDWLAARAIDAPMNFHHLVLWLNAERAWAVGDVQRTIAGFDAALREVAQGQRVWHQALMTERAGLFHMACGLEHAGRSLLTEAHDLYSAWGASAKAQAMRHRYNFLRHDTRQRRKTDRSSSSGSISSDGLDLIGILRASQVLSSETNIAGLRTRMHELLCELTGAGDMSGAMWHEDKQGWYMAPEGMPEDSQWIEVEEAARQGRLPLAAFNYVVRTREPLLVDDALRDDRFNHDPYFAGIDCCSLLGVPVFNQGELRLVLLLENRLGHGAFTADRLEAVNLIAGQLAVSIDNAMLYASLERKVAERTDDLKLANQRLEALSSTDPLTGLANRRRFNEMIEAEWQRAIRPQTPIGVAMIDIDQFKLYNDHYGHLGGDECLRRVARALDKSVRGGIDLVARYGGEEFVIVLPSSDLDAILPVAERARAAVEALQEPHEKSTHGIVTISVGIAAMVPTGHYDAEALVELADAALYRAKKNGRNQVVARKADDLPEQDEQAAQPIAVQPETADVTLSTAPAAQAVRVLMIEDQAEDTELILRELKRGLEAFQFEQVDNADALNKALVRQEWDVVICDYHLPNFGVLPALARVKQSPIYPPFIIVSGDVREENAVEAMKLGANDYIVKSNLARLIPAIHREVKANETRRHNALAEQSLAHERKLLHNLMDNIPDTIFFKDRELRYIRVNRALAAVYGIEDPKELVGRRVSDFLPAELAGKVESKEREIFRTGVGLADKVIEFTTSAGDTVWHSQTEVPIRNEQGEITSLISITRDITERRTAELGVERLNRILAVLSGVNTLIVRVRSRDELYREACRLAVEVGQFADAYIAMFDPGSMEPMVMAASNINRRHLETSRKTLHAVSDAASLQARLLHHQLFRQRQALVINDVERELSGPFHEAALVTGTRALCVLPLVIDNRTVGAFVLRAPETEFFDAEEMKLLVELADDIAFALDHLDKLDKLDYLAYYDPLTGLANATLFRERLAQHLNGMGGKPQFAALILLDLEHFKIVNDALGRSAGDELLKQLAERLADCVGSRDQAAHLGADHFALILTGINGANQVARTIENELQECFNAPFQIGDTDFKAAAKFGIALAPEDGTDAESLFQNAEAALKNAKTSGERYLFYAQHMTERVAERLALENKLRQALEREEFVLHYQPKVALETGHIVGVEALIRWNDPATGLVPPMEFIPLLEETGLILEVGAWALHQAVRDHKRWLESGLNAPRVAVNVSAIQLRQSHFVETVREILAEGASPPGIDLEITESLIMDDVEGNIDKLKAIRDMGLVIAIDDFGTGYSSLAYLAKLPMGTVKIDRSFVITMLHDPNTMTLVSTIISLARSLGLKVVAEGVDQEDQAAVLRSLRCDEMQGYLFSKPVPFEEMSALISEVKGG